MDNKITLKQTDSYSIVMYGFESSTKQRLYYVDNVAFKYKEVLLSGSKEELLDMDREWMKDIVQWVPFVNCYYVYNYVEKDMDFNMDTYKESLESALSTLKENNYILIVKEKNNG